MNPRLNALQQPIGAAIENWRSCARPNRTAIPGKFCRLKAIDPTLHASDLFNANRLDTDNRNWTYLGYGPFANEEDYRAWMTASCLGEDPLFMAIIDAKTERAVGVASYLRIEPTMGVIEVGHINFSPALQQTRAATEAMYLMMGRVFDELGYRRYEWKCDSLNAPSRRAAERLGFSYEGLFRQALIYKGRNRDTAWYSILDSEWPKLKNAYMAWLDDDNFNDAGRQKISLSEIRSSADS